MDSASVETPNGAEPKKEKWFSSPWIVALIGSPVALALLGLFGTSITTIWQNREHLRIERMKFEYSLIQEALKTEYIDEAVDKLQFLFDAHVISTLDKDALQELVKSHRLPIFAGAAIKRRLITPGEAKKLLKFLTIYDGEPNDVVDDKFFKAVADFQYKYNTRAFDAILKDRKEDHLDVDGLLGPKTYMILREVVASRRNSTSDQMIAPP